MSEEIVDGRLRWLFFPEQCRHCIEAPCLEVADDAGAVYRDADTGAILYTAQTKSLGADDIIESCPLAKCDLCNGRIHNGELPACVKTCPTGAMNFGTLKEMQQMAKARLNAVKAKYPQALLADPDEVSVIYLLAYAPDRYHENVIGSAGSHGLTRQMAFKRMLRPFKRAASHLV